MGSMLKTRYNRASYWAMLLTAVAVFAVLIYFTQARLPGELVLVLVCVPRLHDIGRSGWWVGGLILGEVAAAVLGVVLLPPDEAALAIGAYALLLGLVLILLGLVPGQPGANRFGGRPAPGLSFGRAEQAADEAFS